MTTVAAPEHVGPATTSRAPAPSSCRGLLHGGWTRGAGLLAAAAVLVLLTFVSVAYGPRSIPLGSVWDAVWNPDPASELHAIVQTVRVPRTALGLLVGAALGVSGAVLQGITRNPLADPGIFGIQAGASLAVVAGIYTLGITTFTGYVWFGFAGAAVTTGAVLLIGSLGRGGGTPVKLALAGAVLSTMLSALTTAVLVLDVATLDQFRFWVVGALAGRDAKVAWSLLPFLAVGAVLAVACARPLNALALGEDVATSLGQKVGRTRALAVLTVVLLAGASTAACGPIAFVGLTIPHIARGICGPDNRWVLPWSALLGPVLLLGADVIGRAVARPGELQVGIVTALLGAPFFVALVRRRKLAEL